MSLQDLPAPAGVTPTVPGADHCHPHRITIKCRSCGSTDVRRDAYAAWNDAAQVWELATVYDDGFCVDCNGEASLVERWIDAQDQDIGPVSAYDRIGDEK